MPSSEPWRLSPVAEFIYRLHPQSVLDIGIGFGKWGVLAREYTDVTKGRCTNKDWQARIEGIEIWPAYESILWAAYDQVHIGNAAEILPTLGKFDLILAVEILEHLTRHDGLKLIAEIKAHTKHFVVSYSNSLSGPVYGNQYEAHISRWSPDDFPGCKLLCSARAGMSEVYIGQGAVA